MVNHMYNLSLAGFFSIRYITCTLNHIRDKTVCKVLSLSRFLYIVLYFFVCLIYFHFQWEDIEHKTMVEEAGRVLNQIFSVLQPSKHYNLLLINSFCVMSC